MKVDETPPKLDVFQGNQAENSEMVEVRRFPDLSRFFISNPTKDGPKPLITNYL